MIVYEVRADTGTFQSLRCADRDPWYMGRDYLRFMCREQGEKWKPPELYVPEPLKPRGDFIGLQGSDPIAVRDEVYQKHETLQMIGAVSELLPLDFEGERWWVINVLKCVNALNRPASVLPGDPPKLRRKYEFFDYRLPPYPLFKIPETMVNQVLLAHGVVHEDFDLKNICEAHGLTGLKFVELWRSDESTNA